MIRGIMYFWCNLLWQDWWWWWWDQSHEWWQGNGEKPVIGMTDEEPAERGLVVQWAAQCAIYNLWYDLQALDIMQSTYFHVDILLTIQGSQFLMLETNEEGHRQRFWAVGLSGGEFFWLVLVFYWEEEVVERAFKGGHLSSCGSEQSSALRHRHSVFYSPIHTCRK